MKKKQNRAEIIEGAPLHYAPENELGVVFLFSHLFKKLGFKRIELIRSGFPDCVAYKKVRGAEKKVRIEFEFKSKNFKMHRHPARGCDCIVCWEHDWPEHPKHLQIIELRQYYDMGFNVWIQPVLDEWKEQVGRTRSQYEFWSVDRNAHKGDLILFYLTRPEMCVRDVFEIAEDVQLVKNAEWKIGLGRKRSNDYMCKIRRVAQLKATLHFEEMRRHRVLGDAGFVRAQMQGRHCATEYWPDLYGLIVKRNPSLKRTLSRFSPEKKF
ncbi:MAG TPA: hypothetical protein PLZ86_06270 [bacterium]|nr:hypothetical protein [bacterium]